MAPKLALIAALEVAYAVGTRIWLPAYFLGAELELAISAARLLSAAVYGAIFWKSIQRGTAVAATALHPTILAAIIVLLAGPVLIGNVSLPDLTTKAVFALTSLTVALREEIVYRGLVQKLLEMRFGWIAALIASNIAFVAYHFGAQPFTLAVVVQLFVVGCVFGVLFAGYRSLVVPIVVHTLYDAVYAFTPFIAHPLSDYWGNVLQAICLLLCLAWLRNRLKLASAAR